MPLETPRRAPPLCRTIPDVRAAIERSRTLHAAETRTTRRLGDLRPTPQHLRRFILPD